MADNLNQQKNYFMQLLDLYFEEKDILGKIGIFLNEAQGANKWMLYSDYCLGDKNKVNDVMSFALVPFISEAHYKEMQQNIAKLQPKDIKHAQSINTEFLEYIKKQPILVCSFVLDDRKSFFGSDHAHRVNSIKTTLQGVCDCYKTWCETAENNDIAVYYRKVVKTLIPKLNYLNSAKSPNISLLNDILLTAFLGAYFTYKVLADLDVTTFGWFSDRDKVVSGEDNIITPIFNYYLHNLWEGKKRNLFCTMTPDDSVPLFYEEFNRIPDVVSGAIADYSLGKTKAESDKCTTVLTEYIADNPKVLVFRFFVKEGCLRLAKEEIHKCWGE